MSTSVSASCCFSVGDGAGGLRLVVVEEAGPAIEAPLLEHHRVADEQNAVVEERVRARGVPGHRERLDLLAVAEVDRLNAGPETDR